MLSISSTTVFMLADYAGLCLFALSGALAAARLGQTPVTFAFFAIVTGVGGGTIRDVLIDQPVFWVSGSLALVLCLAMAAIVWLTDAKLWPERSMLWLDAIGLGAYSAFGAVKALSFGVSPIVAIIMGVFTAAFGGVLRDILAGQPSVVIGPEIYITAAALGAGATVVLSLLGVADVWSGLFGAGLGFALRAMAIQYNWKLPKYR